MFHSGVERRPYNRDDHYNHLAKRAGATAATNNPQEPHDTAIILIMRHLRDNIQKHMACRYSVADILDNTGYVRIPHLRSRDRSFRWNIFTLAIHFTGTNGSSIHPITKDSPLNIIRATAIDEEQANSDICNTGCEMNRCINLRNWNTNGIRL